MKYLYLACIILASACRDSEVISTPPPAEIAETHLSISESEARATYMGLTGQPTYAMSLGALPRVNEDAIFVTSLNFNPLPQINSTTKLRRGKIVFTEQPSKGIVLFDVNTTAVKGQFTYKPFANQSGIDSFAFYYIEDFVSPPKFSNTLKVTMEILPVNDQPVITGPKAILVEQLLDGSSPADERMFQYAIRDIENQALTIQATGLPSFARFDVRSRKLFIKSSTANNKSFAFKITASDGIATTEYPVNVGIAYQLSPVTPFYNGSSFLFKGSVAWDNNGSFVEEKTRTAVAVYPPGDDKLLVFNLKNRAGLGMAESKFASSGTVDLSKFRYLRLEVAWDVTASVKPKVMFYLVNSLTGKYSLYEETVTSQFTSDSAYSFTKDILLDLQFLASDGFDLTKVTGLALRLSESASLDSRIFVDNIRLIGQTPAPIKYDTPEVILSSAGPDKVRMNIFNSNAAYTGSYKWRLMRYERALPMEVTTTSSVLDLTQYPGFTGGTLSGSVTINNVIYSSINPYEIMPPQVGTDTKKQLLEYDIAYPMSDTMARVRHASAIREASDAEYKAYQSTSADPSLKLNSTFANHLWKRGIIPYRFQSLTVAEQRIFLQIFAEFWDNAGIIFVNSDIFKPKDYVTGEIPVLTIRYMTLADMDSTNPTTQAVLLNERTCHVSAIGASSKSPELLVKNSGDNNCLTLSSPLGTDASRDAYVYNTLRHELLHILGFYHEQIHPEAVSKDSAGKPLKDSNGNYVLNSLYTRVDRIEPWKLGQYQTNAQLYFPEEGKEGLPYDPSSIMMYTKYSNTICDPSGVDAMGANAWNYLLLDPADPRGHNAVYQNQIASLSGVAPHCANNANWRTATASPSCLDVCATLPKSTLEITAPAPAGATLPGIGLSVLDWASLRQVYRFNDWLLLNSGLVYNVSNANIHPANVVGSLSTLAREIRADMNAKKDTAGASFLINDPNGPHFYAQRLFKLAPVRTTRASCKSGFTDLIKGRKSCNQTMCIPVEQYGNIIVPYTTDVMRMKVNEASCTLNFSADGSLCLTGNARGGTSNGTSGFVICEVSAYEFKFTSIPGPP